MLPVNQVASLDEAKRLAKQAATYVDVVAAANRLYGKLSVDVLGFDIWHRLDAIVSIAYPSPDAKYKRYMAAIEALKAKIKLVVVDLDKQKTAIKLLLPLERLGVEIQKNQGKCKSK